MITLENKQFKVTGFTGTITYSFSSEGNISFSNPSGTTTSSSINTNITYANTEDFAFPIRLSVSDSNGCSANYSVTYSNPCGTLTAITSQSNLIAAVTASGGIPPYYYKWTLNEQMVTTDNDENRVVYLKSNVNWKGYNSTIFVKVTDSVGCEFDTSLNIDACRPVLNNYFTQLKCIEETSLDGIANATSFNVIELPYTESCSPIDWTTLEFDDPGLYYKITQISDNKVRITRAKTSNANPLTNVTVRFRVKNEFGFVSNDATLTIQPLDCTNVASTDSPIISKRPEPVTDQSLSAETTIDLSELDPNGVVDWSQFVFKAKSGQTLVSSNSLTGVNGDYVYEDRKIKLTVGPTVSTDVEPVVFDAKDKDGNAFEHKVFFDFTKDDAPGIPVGSASTCLVCEQIVNVDFASAFTGNIDRSTLTIVTPPSNSTAVLNGDGTIKLSYDGTENTAFDIITLKIANNDGVFSAEKSFTIQQTCMGEVYTTKNITCDSKSFNLKDIVDPLIAAKNILKNGTFVWTEINASASNSYTTQGGTISGGELGTVDFTSIDSGTYVFEVSNTITTGAAATALEPTSATSKSQVTIVVEALPAITINSTTKLYDSGASEVHRIYFRLSNAAGLFNLRPLVNGSVATVINSSINTRGGAISSYYDLALDSGSNVITLQGSNQCGGSVSDTTTIVI